MSEIEIPQAAYDVAQEVIIRRYGGVDEEDIENAACTACAALRAAIPIALAAAYTELADQLTELADSTRANRQTTKARGLVEGITVIRERAAQLRGDE